MLSGIVDIHGQGTCTVPLAYVLERENPKNSNDHAHHFSLLALHTHIQLASCTLHSALDCTDSLQLTLQLA